MKIMRASAGSGKTYNLSKTYRELLFDSKEIHPHRHILAVTFTNKATAEMKSRILRDLAKTASDPTENSSTRLKARELLIDILHDYSAFSVSTIDKFFQQALKAFAREIGQFADYQIELDRQSLICECMDRILDSLSAEDKPLLEWIKAFLADKLASGERARIDEGLYDIGMLLKNEEHRELLERLGLTDAELFRKERLEKIRKECADIIADFNDKVAQLTENEEAKNRLRPKRAEKLEFDNKKRLLKKLPELEELVQDCGPAYYTAHVVQKMLYALGLAAEFYREFDLLLKEKNIMCLDESNTILRDIINGSDAPFVYEKLGVRYDHFLLDEFQDTSNIQWSNFLPLLRESESRSGKNLIVGDVKQSIYRFRDSDWKLLATKVDAEFPDNKTEVLDGNWRSCPVVVKFNNAFFEYAAAALGLSELYQDVHQDPKVDDEQQGQVRVSFCDDELEAVYASVQDALASGAKACDVAILVRGKAEGSQIADYLIDKGLSVISDDSLRLQSSVTVKRLLSLLNAFERPEDTVSSYLTQSLELTMPSRYHSLVDLCESLLRSLRDYDEASFESETLFIQSFMDELQSWTDRYGNDLAAFLKAWKQKDRVIGSPQSSDSVRIMTIHKSKGLEFPYVIFPFCEKVTCYKPGEHWCAMSQNAAANGLKQSAEGIYPVNLSRQSANNYFAAAFEEERQKQLVDNINVFYVALTRASKTLHLIASQPSKKFRDAVSGAGVEEYSNLSELLYLYVGGDNEWSVGEPYIFKTEEFCHCEEQRDSVSSGQASEKPSKRIIPFPARYNSIPLNGRLQASTDAADFFSEDGAITISSSARLSGIVLHDILSRVFSAEDVEREVAAALLGGSIDAELASKASSLLYERVAAHAEWFPSSSGDGTIVLNEQSIFDTDGQEHRPDRVIIRTGVEQIRHCEEQRDAAILESVVGDCHTPLHSVRNDAAIACDVASSGQSVEGDCRFVRNDELAIAGEVLIIDFKFGRKNSSHLSQVQAYCNLYAKMGYKSVRGIVWYVAEDTWVEI